MLRIHHDEVQNTPNSHLVPAKYQVFEDNSVRGDFSPRFHFFNDFKLDVHDLERKHNEIDVLILTHTFGFPENIKLIRKIIGNKILIEDCAHSYLSKYDNIYTGNFGDASIFSFGLAKFPPIGTGGICQINNLNHFPLFDQEYKKLNQKGNISTLLETIKILVYSIMLRPPLYGLITYRIGKKLDSKMDFTAKHNFHEYKGVKWVQMIIKSSSTFKKMLDIQSDNAKLLKSVLINPEFTVNQNIKAEPNYYCFPILMTNRDFLFNKLIKNGIEPGKHFHNSINWARNFGYKDGECPNTEKIVSKILTVPIHSGVSKKSILKIAKIINENIE